jgi:uncharacterized membrane protein SirB2
VPARGRSGDNRGVDYLAVRHLHVAAIVASITLFVVRAGWMAYAPERLGRRWVRIAPHVVDTVLLASGLWLAWQLGAEGVRGWLPAKLVGLVLYIVLGAIALKRGPTRGLRIAAAAAAIATFAYIASVALTKSPLGFLVLLNR